MLPVSKECRFAFWVTMLTSVSMMPILLIYWTLMPTLGSFAITICCSLVTFFFGIRYQHCPIVKFLVDQHQIYGM
jgi:hypothetical protein